MGRFADACLHELTDAEIDEYEQLIGMPDPELYAWLSGEMTPPAERDTALFRRLRDFHQHGSEAR